MKYLIIICLFLTSLYSSGSAYRSNLIINNAIGKYSVGPHISYTEDPSGNMSFEDILIDKDKIDWIRNSSNAINFGLSQSTYWLRFNIKNESHTREFILDIDRNQFDTLEVYITEDHKFYERRINPRRGFLFTRKSIQTSQIAIDFESERNSQVYFYIKVRMHSHPFYLPINIWKNKPHLKNQITWVLMNAAFYGATIIMVLYNLAYFISMKQKVNLHFILFMASYTFLNSIIHGLEYTLVLGHSGWFLDRLIPWSASLVGLSTGSFTENALQTEERAPFFHKVIKYLQLFGCFLAVFTLVGDVHTLLWISVAYGFTGYIWLLIVSIYLAYKKYEASQTFLLGYLATIISVYAYVAMVVGIAEPNFFSLYGIYIGIVLQCVIFPNVIAEKVNAIERDKKIGLERTQSLLHKRMLAVDRQVKKQTSQITNIMRNIPIGIFTIDGKNKKIGGEYTKHLEEILGSDNLAGKKFEEVLLEKTTLGENEKSQMKSFLNTSIGDDSLGFELNYHLAPKEVCIDTKIEKKILEVEYNPVIGKDNIVESILVVVKDVTDQKKFEKEAEESKREINIINQIVNVPKDKFFRFISTSKSDIFHNIDLLRKSKYLSQEDRRNIFIDLHTMKGSSRTYNFSYITEEVHKAEQKYLNDSYSSINELLTDLHKVQSLVEEYITVSEDKIGIKILTDKFSLGYQTMRDIYHFVHNEEIVDISNKMKLLKLLRMKVSRDIEHSYFRSVSDVIHDIFASGESLAKNMKKGRPGLFISSTKRRIDDEGARVLVNVFVHILRNSLDHGIESFEERERKKKSLGGNFYFVQEDSDDGIEIKYSDDGRGLDLRKIKDKAIKLNLIDGNESYSPDEISKLILVSGLSTAEQVTDISGRGVGMDAINSYLKQAEGLLKIELVEGPHDSGYAPFYLIINLPNKFLNKPQEFKETVDIPNV